MAKGKGRKPGSGARKKAAKTKKPVRKAPATAEVLVNILPAAPDTLRGKRDRALLLIGFGAALRRSELVDLNVNDIDWRPGGALIHIGRSKTDQEGKGQAVVVPNGHRLEPVAALRDWLTSAEIVEGPLFREIDRHGNVGTDALSTRAVARASR